MQIQLKFLGATKTLIGKMKINIAGGSGLMGRIHKPVFERAGHEILISGRESSPSLEEAAKISDVTIVSVPIHATEDVVRRVAPYCRALMDFTSVKVIPMKWMTQNAPKDCEIMGMHPLYGDVSSIKGRTVVYCSAMRGLKERSGERTYEVLKSLESAGAKLKQMDPRLHDFQLGGYLQIGRMESLDNFGMFLANSGLSFEEAYELSPPPTRIMLNLLARQVDESNDKLHLDMAAYNQFSSKAKAELSKKTPYNSSEIPKVIRKWFGAGLAQAQERAQKYIDSV